MLFTESESTKAKPQAGLDHDYTAFLIISTDTRICRITGMVFFYRQYNIIGRNYKLIETYGYNHVQSCVKTIVSLGSEESRFGL